MMGYKLEEAPGGPVSESECRHYWMIEDARGPASRGVCKFCWAETPKTLIQLAS